MLTAEDILREASRNGQICPLPEQWNRLWEMLPRRQRTGNDWEPPLPLILAGWIYSSDEQKRDRFEEHIRWAESTGALASVHAFLQSIPKTGWHTSPKHISTQDQTDAALKTEYFEAWFHCSNPSSSLPTAFGIITPFNPYGRTLTEEANSDRLAKLEEILRQQHLVHFRVDGGSRDGKHLECGFGVVGLSLSDLRNLGTQFEQDAIFWVENDQVSLVSCRTGERRIVCRWSERLPGSAK